MPGTVYSIPLHWLKSTEPLEKTKRPKNTDQKGCTG